jgi:hypothetical protein
VPWLLMLSAGDIDVGFGESALTAHDVTKVVATYPTA